MICDLYRHLERARIVFAIENEMSTEERDSPTNKYWTNIDDERYLQVEEVDEQAFLSEDDDDDEDDAHAIHHEERDSRASSEGEQTEL